jgi:multiple sugar transport system substrate-binding protein
MKLINGILVVILLFVGACQSLPSMPETAEPPTTLELPTPTPVRTPTPEPGTPSPVPVALKIWVPPQFDPYSETSAGRLLRTRMEQFLQLNSHVRLDIRIKAMKDLGETLEALSSASAAAPLSLPDLIALPRPVMEAAALKGLLFPMDGLTSVPDGSDWYEYARQLARLQNSTFGIPFAADALLMLFQPGLFEEGVPSDWSQLLEFAGPVIFPAADPQAIYTLNLYQSAGGKILDEQGRPNLEAEVLTRVLITFQEAESSGLLPLWLTQLENDGQAWDAYLAGRGPVVITWASRFLGETETVSEAVPVPTLDGTPLTLANGWVWSLAGHSSEKQVVAVQLAEFLTEATFMAEWTAAAGYLPPRSEALRLWPAGEAQALASQLINSAAVIPSGDVLSSLGPLLRQGTIQMLKQQGEPVIVAEDMVERLQNPY